MTPDSALRDQLLQLLRGGHAHMSFEEAVKDFPQEFINAQPPDIPFTPWRLLEHLRIAQWDILEFIHNPDYVWLDWPKDYWPPEGAQADQGAWERSLDAFHADGQALQDLVADPHTNLTADLPHAPGYNILREILVVSDHNAYHIAELALLRQLLGAWPRDRPD